MKKLYIDIFDYFERLISSIEDFRKQTISVGNHTLYPAEMHMIAFIKDNPGKNMTDLADIIGITKGGVSQMVTKLCKKKFITKYRSPTNCKEVFFKLTNDGEFIYSEHKRFHEEELSDVEKLLAQNYTDDEIKVIIRFLNDSNEYIRKTHSSLI
ncbi:MAG: hypothetical protein A2015_16730 [Spirochaetes bacterium GWF1_31_7]|nr:MAG: hypothetical protein A2Y30_14095 [Spirochaetes bacterium GWE1_32_154]OHD50088.1 MAG: hypothetical protein A2Y29_12140 [Spirochaetes bacterium GWE2_31_10]OHD52401.1 MAG: hypothetical protein A2015_16730 [Spirochaetes bacterium GWF1_31_7]OHD82638.1 MAG: hypothetical protein A2355_15070 [Spirochaetes bacterium RIFOXYB1_FULL_32_8]HBD96045.1 transcriptional regulator [Spirochaetia bacterium]